MPTAIGFNDDGLKRLFQLLGVVVAGYGAYQALQHGKLTSPHTLMAVAGFLAAVGPEL